MNYKILSLCVAALYLSSCAPYKTKNEEAAEHLHGTWQLISATNVEKGKSTTVDYTKGQSMIKIINDSHFAFMTHKLQPDSAGKYGFDAGGGTYKLDGDQYTETLEYYTDRNLEGHAFQFTIKIKNDTLTQTGVEKVEKAGIDRTITEKYVKVKKKV